MTYQIKPDYKIPAYFANHVAENGFDTLSHSLKFLGSTLVDYENMDKEKVGELGCLLLALHEYAELIQHLNND